MRRESSPLRFFAVCNHVNRAYPLFVGACYFVACGHRNINAFELFYTALTESKLPSFAERTLLADSDNKISRHQSTAIKNDLITDRSSLLEAILTTGSSGLESAALTTARLNDRKELHDRRFSCQKCKIMFRLLRSQIRVSLSDSVIRKSMHRICLLLNLGTKEACTAGFDIYASQLLHVLRNTRMRTSDICAFVVGPKCEEVDDEYKWSVTIPPNLLTFLPDREPTESADETAPAPLKILHITDVHLDPHYSAGTEVNCRQKEHQFLCCQFDSTTWSKEPSQMSGILGSVGYCDLPIATFEKSIEHMASAPGSRNVDLIYFTGDVNAHDYWRHNISFTTHYLDDFFRIVKLHYPNTPMLFAVGNHDTVPSNFYPPANAPDDVGGNEIRWFYANLRRLLALHYNIDATDIVKGGYYSVKLRPGWRIVAINTNHCYTWNGWLLLDPNDPDGQLHWLVAQLFDAELRGEKVHILGHSDPAISSDCIDSWRENFLRIMKRFHRTVVAQFYGHSHNDHVSVLVSDTNTGSAGLRRDEDEALTISYTAASLTPFRTHFPSYRVYDVNGTTWRVVDYRSYFLDLDTSNVAARLFWKHEYDAKTEYGLVDLSPQSWLQFLQALKLKTNPNSFTKYYQHYAKLPLANIPECNDDACIDFLLEDTIVKI